MSGTFGVRDVRCVRTPRLSCERIKQNASVASFRRPLVCSNERLGRRHTLAGYPPKSPDTKRMTRSPIGCSYGRRSRFAAANSTRTCTQSTSNKTMTIVPIRMNTDPRCRPNALFCCEDATKQAMSSQPLRLPFNGSSMMASGYATRISATRASCLRHKFTLVHSTPLSDHDPAPPRGADIQLTLLSTHPPSRANHCRELAHAGANGRLVASAVTQEQRRTT